MVISSFPPASTSPIRSIQRGTAATSGTIAISSVDTTKTFVNSFSTGTTGTAAISGTLSGPTGTFTEMSGINAENSQPGSFVAAGGASVNNTTRTITMNTANFSGGSTNLTSAVFGVHLTNATTITATGACRYEVIEYL